MRCIKLEAGVSGVTIEGFEIRNYGKGIQLFGASNNSVRQNKLFDNGSGIWLEGANDNQVIENEVTGSTSFGIIAVGSTGNLIKKNKVSDSGGWDLNDSSAPPPLNNTWEKNKYETGNIEA